MLKFVYPLLLVASVIFVFWKGKSDERLVLAALVIGSFATGLINVRLNDWLIPNVALIINELAVSLVILWVAFRSKRFWPLPVAAFQMLALLANGVSLVGRDLQSYAVGLTQGMWAYPQLIILVVATIRGRMKP